MGDNTELIDNVRLRRNVDPNVAAPNAASSCPGSDSASTTIWKRRWKPTETEGKNLTNQSDTLDSKEQLQNAMDTIARLQEMVTKLKSSRDHLCGRCAKSDVPVENTLGETAEIIENTRGTNIVYHCSMILSWSILSLLVYNKITASLKINFEEDTNKLVVVLSAVVCFADYIKDKSATTGIVALISVILTAVCIFMISNIQFTSATPLLDVSLDLFNFIGKLFILSVLCFTLCNEFVIRIDNDDLWVNFMCSVGLIFGLFIYFHSLVETTF